MTPPAAGTRMRGQATMLMYLQISYTTAVQDVCLLRDGVTLVVAVRDSHLLRVLKLDALDVSHSRSG